MTTRQAWQRSITDDTGNLLTGVQISVFQQDGTTLATIYSGLTGAATPNPFNTGVQQVARFYAEAGLYVIRAFKSGFGTQEWLNVDISGKAVREDLGAVVSRLDQNGTPPAPNFAVYPEANYIDPDTQGSSIWGVGWTVFPNKIGAVAKPLGPDGTNAAEWSPDTGYDLATLNDASVATILGGYDHICNQIAGVIGGGGHNYMQYNSEGHSLIGGGSYNWISAGRAVIHYGTNCRVAGEGIFNGVHNGHTNKILGGSHNNILGGEFITIDTPSLGYCWAIGRSISITGASRYASARGISLTMTAAVRSLIDGGQLHVMTSAQDCAIVGGASTTHTNTFNCASVGGEGLNMSGATYAGAVGGRLNTQSGRSSFMAAAEDSNDNGARGLFAGRKAQGVNANFQATIGCNHPTSGVLSQAMTVAQGATTTGSSISAPDDQQVKVGNVGTSTIAGSVLVTAHNITDGTTAGYKVDFIGTWNGSAYTLNGAAADLAMSAIGTPGAGITAPTLAFNTGALRVRFGGTASKTINWSAALTLSLMRA